MRSSFCISEVELDGSLGQELGILDSLAAKRFNNKEDASMSSSLPRAHV